MRHPVLAALAAATLAIGPGRADAQGAKPLAKCAPDAVPAGTVCMDTYEASVWRVPLPLTANKGLVKKIRQGKARVADLAKGGATQLGTAADDYAPCADNGQNCGNDVFAVSIAGVLPSGSLTWFQAQAACKNAAKRLPFSAEWQAAVMGAPNPGGDDGTTTCNSQGLGTVVAGSRSTCVSTDGAFDMVGNLSEWTADWITRAAACGAWNANLAPTSDAQCIGGAATTGEPGALVRGGSWEDGAAAGPFSVRTIEPSLSGNLIGFRCAR